MGSYGLGPVNLVRAEPDASRRGPGLVKEALIQSEIPCGIGMCRPKSNNLAMT